MRHHLPTAAILIAGALALAACSGSLDLEGAIDASPASSPSPSPSGEPTTAPLDISDPEVVPVSDGDWPSQLDGYVFSDEPQGYAEQWIVNHFPELWELGVRAVSTENTLLSYDAMRYEPGPTVQYINGERYEGTPQMPLGFRGQTEDPDSFATDVFENVKESLRDPSKSIAEIGNVGNGGYGIFIAFSPEYKPLPDSQDTFLYIQERDRGGLSDSGSPRVFADYQEALDWVLSNPIVPNLEGEGVRELNRGEIASIGISREKMDGTRSNRESGVYNPDSGQIEWIE